MGTKHNDRCLDKVDDDEPIFVLRAQDMTAPSVVGYWIARNPQLSKDRVDEANHQADLMAKWQRDHPERVKMPD